MKKCRFDTYGVGYNFTPMSFPVGGKQQSRGSGEQQTPTYKSTGPKEAGKVRIVCFGLAGIFVDEQSES